MAGVVEWEEAGDRLAFATGDDEERPREIILAVFLFPLRGVIEEWKDDASRGALRRTHLGVERPEGLVVRLALRADAGGFFEEEGPDEKEFFVATDDFNVTQQVSPRGGDFILNAEERPELPTAHTVAGAGMDERIEEVIRHHVPLARLDIDGEHREVDFVTQKLVLDRAVEREQGEVVPRRVGAYLPVVERKDHGAPILHAILVAPAVDVNHRCDERRGFVAKAVIAEQRGKRLAVEGIHVGLADLRVERRHAPLRGAGGFLVVVERADRLGAGTGLQGQAHLVEDRAGGNVRERLPINLPKRRPTA